MESQVLACFGQIRPGDLCFRHRPLSWSCGPKKRSACVVLFRPKQRQLGLGFGLIIPFGAAKPAWSPANVLLVDLIPFWIVGRPLCAMWFQVSAGSIVA